MKQIVVAFLNVCTVLGFAYSGGDGTGQSPFLIGSASELLSINSEPNTLGLHFQLTADIDLAGLGDKTDGSFSAAPISEFLGIFDGGDRHIQNLVINANSNYIGLFGQLLDDAQVRNLTVENCQIAGTADFIGALCGWNESGQIVNCSVSGIVAGGPYLSSYIGGVCGYNDGTISHCGNNVDVTGNHYVGGVCGFNDAGTVINCANNGTINGTFNAGGICGLNTAQIINSANYGTLVGNANTLNTGGVCGSNYDWLGDCYNVLGVSGRSFAGGVCGFNEGNIARCYNAGLVSATNQPGGLCAFGSFGDVQQCFWDTETSGIDVSDGGVGLSTTAMKQQATFAGWDFMGTPADGQEDIWWIHENIDYPRLWWERTNMPPIADAGPDQVVYAWIDGMSKVQLDGSASYDLDGDDLTYSWITEGNVIAVGIDPNIVLPVGKHEIGLIVSDGIENSEPNSVTITVVEANRTSVMILPRTMNIKSKRPYVIGILELPQGVLLEDVNLTQDLLLMPGGLKPVRRFIIPSDLSMDRPICIIAFFEASSFYNAVGSLGQSQATLAVALKSGQVIYGTDTIRLICPGNHRTLQPIKSLQGQNQSCEKRALK